jgi:hypothetical protein
MIIDFAKNYTLEEFVLTFTKCPICDTANKFRAENIDNSIHNTSYCKCKLLFILLGEAYTNLVAHYRIGEVFITLTYEGAILESNFNKKMLLKTSKIDINKLWEMLDKYRVLI